MSITREEFLGTTQARSDQINAADLLGGPLVCRITDIELTGSAEQPISIYVDAHPQPWKPSKTSRRVLAACWSDVEPSQWVGRYVILRNDETVKWAGEAVGGIRSSHLSHIDGVKTIMVNTTRGKKGAQRVEPYYPAESERPVEVAYYPEDKFEANFPQWCELIKSGKKTNQQIVTNVERGGKLTQGQRDRILSVQKEEEPEPAPDALTDDGGDPFAE